MKYMNCPRCSNSINKNIIFCPRCGLDLNNEEKLWEDKPKLIYGLITDPFVKYEITTSRLVIKEGIFSKITSEIELRRIDFSKIIVKQNFFLKLMNVGNIIIISNNNLNIYNIKNPYFVKDLLRRVILFQKDKISQVDVF